MRYNSHVIGTCSKPWSAAFQIAGHGKVGTTTSPQGWSICTRRCACKRHHDQQLKLRTAHDELINYFIVRQLQRRCPCKVVSLAEQKQAGGSIVRERTPAAQCAHDKGANNIIPAHALVGCESRGGHMHGRATRSGATEFARNPVWR